MVALFKASNDDGFPPKLRIQPPLLNTACPWATTIDNLRDLLRCPFTGAVTTRTSVLSDDGFNHRPQEHRYVFFDPLNGTVHSKGSADEPLAPETWHLGDQDNGDATRVASVNSLGYSPISLKGYLDMLKRLSLEMPEVRGKMVIISVTGTPEEIAPCYALVESAGQTGNVEFPLALEINLSCPNIPGAPPPAYNAVELDKYLAVLPKAPTIPVGMKTPPYTYEGQFDQLLQALMSDNAGTGKKISFITATNTLGSCLVMGGADPSQDQRDVSTVAALPGNMGLGGMAGPPLHPLALGNVKTLRQKLNAVPELAHIDVIGVGGVSDANGYKRMRVAGASAVGVATVLGRFGVDVFEKIGTIIAGAHDTSGVRYGISSI